MYKRLSENETRQNYRRILEETIWICSSRWKETSFPLYQDILAQLQDLKENVVEKKILTDWEDIDERYSLGGIAVKNFADGDEMQDRLIDIFGGAGDYWNLPETG